MKRYDPSTEETMKRFFKTLSEKERRRYAGVEALKLGHGGVSYISQLLGCNRNTVAQGVEEVTGLPPDSQPDNRVRQVGGGRKRVEVTHPEIDDKFLAVLKHHTAGDPMDETVRWTNLTHQEIAKKLAEEHNIQVSQPVIGQLLKKHHYRRRKAQKKQTMKQVPNRNEQFENIATLRAEFEAMPNPIVSIDTKKKEYLGNFYRAGQLYTLAELQTYDHDFVSFAEGVIIPHGIYDLKRNQAYLNLGTTKDTSQFACDSLKQWWLAQGQFDYPQATSILILCDGGGSNNAHHYIFKQDLQSLANELGLELRIAHYPPYCSKYNPIEHRLFPHVTRACQGVVFKSVELVKELMAKTKTTSGLRVTVNIIDKVYETGRKATVQFIEHMPIVFDDYLSKWNYVAIPNAQVI